MTDDADTVARDVAAVALSLAEQAIREGRHSSRFEVVCPGCRRWVEGFWSRMQDGTYLCRECSPELPRLTFEDLDRMRAPEDRGKPL
jgi:hypothetical protein